MRSAKAFAPANISCVFRIHENADPAKSGSTGMGFTLDKGVTAEVFLSEKTEIFFNKKEIDFPTVKSVIEKIRLIINHSAGFNFRVNISSPLPLGYGFGLSGASALATAYALNKLLGLKKTKLTLAKIAHIAEAENKTGLGDVVNQYFGGFLLKTVSSSEFKVHKIPIENIPVYCKYFSGISTKSFLSNVNMKEKIEKAAKEALEKAQNRINEGSPLFADLISISKEFAEKSGLLKDEKVIQAIFEVESRGGHASMIMLGNAVFSDIPFEAAGEYKIIFKGAEVL